MSDGSILESYASKIFLYQMIDGATGADAGAWIDARTLRDGVLEFYNESGVGSITSFTCQVIGSNSLSNPGGAAGFDIGSPVTALGGVELLMLARWIKVSVTDLGVTGGATLGVRMHSHIY